MSELQHRKIFQTNLNLILVLQKQSENNPPPCIGEYFQVPYASFGYLGFRTFSPHPILSSFQNLSSMQSVHFTSFGGLFHVLLKKYIFPLIQSFLFFNILQVFKCVLPYPLLEFDCGVGSPPWQQLVKYIIKILIGIKIIQLSNFCCSRRKARYNLG